MVNRKRITMLNDIELKSGAVVYWMSRDQRVGDNWALLFAQELALELKAPLAVVFCLVPEFLGATIRQYGFMVKGLRQVEEKLSGLEIPFYLLTGAPGDELPRFMASRGAGALVTDFSPLRIRRVWNRRVAKALAAPFYEVDAHNIVPCRIASGKSEFAAYTFRPKILRALQEFLTDFPPLVKHPFPRMDKNYGTDWDRVLEECRVDCSVPEVDRPEPGESAGHRALRDFLENRLQYYHSSRNDPNACGQSGLSPYLHFGHISPQRVALEVERNGNHVKSQEAFLEELVVRRELSDNFCFYNEE
jgi:deoxyribodipyrimidine photo-lyase